MKLYVMLNILGIVALALLGLFIAAQNQELFGKGVFNFGSGSYRIYLIDFSQNDGVLRVPFLAKDVNVTDLWGFTDSRGNIVIDSRLSGDVRYLTCNHEVCHNYIHDLGLKDEEEVCGRLESIIHFEGCNTVRGGSYLNPRT